MGRLGKQEVFMYLTAKIKGNDRINDRVDFTISDTVEGREGVIKAIEEFRDVFLATYDAVCPPGLPHPDALAEPKPAGKADHVLEIQSGKMGTKDTLSKPPKDEN